MAARLSMRSAIDAMCKRCIYDELAAGTWRAQVAECSSSTCPLHPLRPLPIKRSDGQNFAHDGCKIDQGVYGPMCFDPKLCAGKGYCPRDPTCAD